MESSCCAHMRVIYIKHENDDGTYSDRWECDSCGTPFWPRVAAQVSDLHQLRAEVAGLNAEVERLRGAMAADDSRLREAERRVWKDPDMTWGCDAPEHFADTILELRAEVERLRLELASVSKDADTDSVRTKLALSAGRTG